LRGMKHKMPEFCSVMDAISALKSSRPACNNLLSSSCQGMLSFRKNCSG
jgi:hypothetical protein